MHRATIIACLPCLLALFSAVATLWLTVRIGGGKWEWPKLRRLHTCEAGSVQTLSFVFTLPIFIMLMMFIVQVAELMMGIVVVEYAAFAAARSALVWIPAEVPGSDEPANFLRYPSLEDRPFGLERWRTRMNSIKSPEAQSLWKLRKVSTAGAMACLPICPSRSYLSDDEVPNPLIGLISRTGASMAPTVRRFPNFDRIVQRRCNYSSENTWLIMQGVDRDLQMGPTYNPPQTYPDPNDPEQFIRSWNPNEIGWEDAIEVRIIHYFALLPGPARFLATKLVSSQVPDDVSKLIVRPGELDGFSRVNANKYRGQLKTVLLTATCTLSNEGLKSTMPYVQPVE